MIILAFYLKIYFKEEILMSNEEKNFDELGKNSESLNDVAGGARKRAGVALGWEDRYRVTGSRLVLQDTGMLQAFLPARTTDEVKAIAAKHGLKITDSGAEHVLKGLTLLRKVAHSTVMLQNGKLPGSCPVSDSEVDNVSGGLVTFGLNQGEIQYMNEIGASFAIKFSKKGDIYFRYKVEDTKTGKKKNKWSKMYNADASDYLGAIFSVDSHSGETIITGPNGE